MGSLKRNSGMLTGALCVGVGAAIGTLIRAFLEESFPHADGAWPLATFAINLIGSVILGFLLTALANSGPDTGWRHTLRLTAGTGVIGGFTTYSTFIIEVHELALPLSLAYAGTSVITGIACAVAGIALANALIPPTGKEQAR
ncbi:MAG: fluoride efflux transporter FluC [Ancrocorticia sp.]|uniref:fluoride efflux transporter FluC n=1 Tax=Ancrocorticia sp. TaxID=2593684 RepID=UPI003F8E7502